MRDIDLSAYTNGNTGTFSWAAPHTSVGHNVGRFQHSMIFTPTDRTKHLTVSNKVHVLVSLVDMVRIPAGSFMMGSPTTEAGRNNDEAQWPVALSGFYMGKYEITQKQYEIVMGETFEEKYKKSYQNWFLYDYGQGDNFPAYYISWYDALIFCNKLSMMEGLTPAYSKNGETDPTKWGAVPNGAETSWDSITFVADSTGYRLPTEAQWEYACRAGTTTPWYFGDTSDRFNDYAWSLYNSSITSYGYIINKETTARKAHEVGTLKPNLWGLYDMYGNVSEWCWDWKDTYPDGARLNPTGASSSPNRSRVSRGANYNGDTGRYMRSAVRSQATPGSRTQQGGFRIVRPEGHAPQPDYSINLSAIEYSVNAPGISSFLGWYWGGSGEFPWIFKNDGTISTLHCCGAEFPAFCYLLRGNVLVTYDDTKGLEVSNFTTTDNGVTFVLNTGGERFRRFFHSNPYLDIGSDPNVPIVVSNDLIGTWYGDGTYTFGNDSTLTIGSNAYAYLVWNKNVVILGPLVDGQTTELKQYTYILNNNSLSLVGKDTDTPTITLTK